MTSGCALPITMAASYQSISDPAFQLYCFPSSGNLTPRNVCWAYASSALTTRPPSHPTALALLARTSRESSIVIHDEICDSAEFRTSPASWVSETIGRAQRARRITLQCPLQPPDVIVWHIFDQPYGNYGQPPHPPRASRSLSWTKDISSARINSILTHRPLPYCLKSIPMALFPVHREFVCSYKIQRYPV